MLTNIVEAKNKHDEHPQTQKARTDSGFCKGHKLDDEREKAREQRDRAFHELRQGSALEQRMKTAMKTDEHNGIHYWEWYSEVQRLWNAWEWYSKHRKRRNKTLLSRTHFKRLERHFEPSLRSVKLS